VERVTEASLPTDTVTPVGELRTFLIADVRGYTRFTVDHGDEAAARLATTFARLAREAAAAHGGEVIELRGDEALAVFSSARQALRAAIGLQVRCVQIERENPSMPLRVGVGIDAGEAIPVEGGFRGAALNLAARLCSLAGPREVLASEGVIHLARRTEGLTYVERGSFELKGFVEPVRVLQILSETDMLEEAGPAENVAGSTISQPSLPIGAFLGALPAGQLAGREDEINHLSPSLDAVEAGSGQLILLAGETGIGKTRLAQEIAVLARDRGFIVGTGRCFESDRDVPLFPFLEALSTVYAAAPTIVRSQVARRWPLLARLIPDVAGTPLGMDTEEREDGQQLFRSVAGFLEAIAEQRPIALLIDDLQWADEGSLRLLQHLARHTRGGRILLAGTYREAGLERDAPLERVLRELNRERLIDRLTLRRLSADGSAAMVAETIGDMDAPLEFADFVHRRTKGNPPSLRRCCARWEDATG
jgi:class 3 adenylate cyclase